MNPPSVDKYIVFNHLENLTFFNKPSFAFVKEMIFALSKYNPERLGQVIAYQPPAIFRTFFNTVKGFLDPRTVSKLVFVIGDVSEGSENDELMKAIVGEGWKQKTGAEQKVLKQGSSPGYDHQVFWPTVITRLDELSQNKSAN
jgi:hypothetical protein